MLVFAVVVGVLMEKTGTYKPLHAASFAIAAVDFGLLTLLDESTAKWAIFQLIVGGLASSTATYSFIRTFGYVWGVTIASTIFNGVFDQNLPHIWSPELRQQLRNGQAYGFASQARSAREIASPDLWAEAVDVYQHSLRTIWFMGIGIACFLMVWVEKTIPLRKELETQYGLDDTNISFRHIKAVLTVQRYPVQLHNNKPRASSQIETASATELTETRQQP
ncbi:Nn.00g100720.m01.CDS01 [Neocucurbitaria sp. VM-36]